MEYDVRHLPYIVYKNVHTYDLRCMQVCIKTLFIVFVAAVGKTEVMILADVGEDLTTKPKTCIYDPLNPKPDVGFRALGGVGCRRSGTLRVYAYII